jgi:hypothetical protein
MLASRSRIGFTATPLPEAQWTVTLHPSSRASSSATTMTGELRRLGQTANMTAVDCGK